MNGFDAKFWLDASQWIVGALTSLALALGGFAVWITRRQNQTRAQVEKVQTEAAQNLREAEKQITEKLAEGAIANARILERLEHLPDERTLRDLLEKVGSTAGAVEAMQATLSVMQTSVQQLVENEFRGR